MALNMTLPSPACGVYGLWHVTALSYDTLIQCEKQPPSVHCMQCEGHGDKTQINNSLTTIFNAYILQIHMQYLSEFSIYRTGKSPLSEIMVWINERSLTAFNN